MVFEFWKKLWYLTSFVYNILERVSNWYFFWNQSENLVLFPWLWVTRWGILSTLLLYFWVRVDLELIYFLFHLIFKRVKTLITKIIAISICNLYLMCLTISGWTYDKASSSSSEDKSLSWASESSRASNADWRSAIRLKANFKSCCSASLVDWSRAISAS